MACYGKDDYLKGIGPTDEEQGDKPVFTETPSSKRARVSEAITVSRSSKEMREDDAKHNRSFYVTPQSKILADRASPPQLSRDEVKSLLLNEAGYDIDENPTKNLKRQGYLSWDDMFFGVAVLSSRRSKNPNTPCGACIVDSENRIIGIGYDGAPRGCPDDCLPWSEPGKGDPTVPFLHTHKPYGVHAEINAILNKCSADVAGASMYVERFPCNECAKVIIQSRIREVVYMEDLEPQEETYRASRILLGMAGVKTRQYAPTVPYIDLDFVRALAPTTKEVQTNSDSSAPACDSCVARESGSASLDLYRQLMVNEAEFDPFVNRQPHRTDYISWDDYFIAMSFLTAKRSKDPNTQVGAVIVDSDTKRILALGYNGFPRGCSDDDLPWARTGDSELHKKYLFVVHAEVNAVLNKCSSDVKGATLYVALFPCNDCAKVIIQAGIKEVVFMADFYHDTDACRASRIMFAMAGVKLRKHIPSFQSLRLVMSKTDPIPDANKDG